MIYFCRNVDHPFAVGKCALGKLWRVAGAEPTVLQTNLHLLDADKIVADTLFSHCRRVSYFIDMTRLHAAGLIATVFMLAITHPGSTPTRSRSRSTSRGRAGITRCPKRELKNVLPVHGARS